MNILSIIGILSSMFNIGAVDWISEIFNKALLFFDGIAYTLLAYSFKLFQLMCTLNFNSLQGLISPVLNNIKALVMVFVVYKLGISLINFMLNPDEAAKKGKEILINIFITAALLLTYNTIFGIFNELSMLIIGTPENYSFIYLEKIADVTNTKDVGLINRVVFSSEEEIPDVGKFIAFSVASTFITDANDPQNTEPLRREITNQNTNEIDFELLPNIASLVGKKFIYFKIAGFFAACFMIYAFVKATIQIGVRAFKLLILHILAPIAIITVIGEGTKGKTFKNFVNKYISVYIEVFIRVFSMLLICNFVVKFIRNITDFFSEISEDGYITTGLMIVLIIVAAFKFATDIPKFIDEILSTHLSTGKEKNFIGSLLGAGIGLAAGLSTGTLGGTISGLAGGISAGGKGNSIADFFKGMASNSAHARDIAANQRMVGGHVPGLSSLRYGMTRLGGAVGLPQGRLEGGKLAGERQTALDNMIKTLEDNYDEQVNIGGQNVGLSRDIFKNYAYDNKTNKYGFYSSLSQDTRTAVDNTSAAYDVYAAAQGSYDEMRTTGRYREYDASGAMTVDREATQADIATAWDKVESSRTAYQSLKSSTDKKIDTDFNTRMLTQASKDEKVIKAKGRNAVKRSIEAYNHVASHGYKTKDFIGGTTIRTPDRKRKTSNTKFAGDHYSAQQDRTTYSRSGSSWNNSNSRGSGSSK